MSDTEVQIIEDTNSRYKRYRRDLPVDLNLIDSALFIKNKNWSKSREVKIKNQSITIVGGKYVDNSTNNTVELSVPGEFDENVLYAVICQMLKYKELHNLQDIPQTFICTYADIINNLKLGRQRQDLIRDSLRKLRYTVYYINNNFLTREDGNPITEDEALADTTLKKIKKISIETGISFLQEFTEVKVEGIDLNELRSGSGIDENNLKSMISEAHGSTQYFLKISLDTRLYNNLKSKVYMLHSLEFLLELPGIERAIHMFSHLNVGREIYQGKVFPIPNKLVVNVGVVDLAEKIPLAITDKKINSTYQRIVDALSFLMSAGYIKTFNVDKQRPIRKSKFTIEFYEEQSRSNDEFKAYDLRVSKHTTKESPNLSAKELRIVDNGIEQFASQKHKRFSEIIANIQKTLGMINSGNMVTLKEILEEHINEEILYKDKIVSNSKGLIIIEAISDWLLSYNDIKRLNGLLARGIKHSPQPLYIDAYNEIVQKLYNECLLREEQESQIKQEQEKFVQAEEQRKLARINFNACLSEWRSAYHKASMEIQERFKSIAQDKYEKVLQKNISPSIDAEDLTILLFAIDQYGSSKVIEAYRKAYSSASADLMVLGIKR